MNKLVLLLTMTALAGLIQSCVSSTGPQKREDPLIGQLLDVKTRTPVTMDTLVDRIRNTDVIYLSEKHDNPDHHAFQQKIIQALAKGDDLPVLGFEFFSMEETPDLLNFMETARISHKAKAEKTIEEFLRKKLGWDTQSDEMWAFYFDLLSLGRELGLYAAGLDLPDTLKRRITRKGRQGLTPLEQEMVFSTDLDDPPYKDHMFEVFKAVHCGMGHAVIQERLWDTWLARNDRMAQSIVRLKHHHKGPVVVIIGGGHTEYGLGVMDRVAHLDPGLSQVNIALKEIAVSPAGLDQYLVPLSLSGRDALPPADYVRFSQRISYENPCDRFREQLKRMKSRKPKSP